MQDSYDEIKKVLRLMRRDDISVYHGSSKAIATDSAPVESDGVRLIIEEAMR